MRMIHSASLEPGSAWGCPSSKEDTREGAGLKAPGGGSPRAAVPTSGSLPRTCAIFPHPNPAVGGHTAASSTTAAWAGKRAAWGWWVQGKCVQMALPCMRGKEARRPCRVLEWGNLLALRDRTAPWVLSLKAEALTKAVEVSSCFGASKPSSLVHHM